MRISLLGLSVCMLAWTASAQTANGTITGSVNDQTGSVVPNAAVEVKNTETGSIYRALSTATGNYTATQLPVGRYEISVAVQGFKKYTRQGLELTAAQIMRIDIPLEIGSTGEVLTVNAEASLLKTESSDVTHNITIDNMTNLPILGIGGNNTGSSGIRNPYNSTVMIPGVRYVVNSAMVVNGANSNSESVRIEGQDATNHTLNAFSLQQEQPSADSIQEVAIQTSNYAAEFGTAGGGVFNITMKSGTNQYHGTAYDYMVNEFLFAGYPFSSDGAGHKLRPRQRRNDYGGSMGGPIYIPKVYDGRNKTFFFYNWEEYIENQALNISQTLPIDAYRNGDFSAISPNGTCSLCSQLGIPTTPLASKDALGRNIFANTIYDPGSRAINAANGQGYATAFVGNKIPLAQFDPTAKKILNLIPAAGNQSLLTANTTGSQLGQRTTAIPSLKIDQSINSKQKASFFWNNTGTDSQFSLPLGGADALPDLISAARGTFIHSRILRLNYDYSMTPTMLLHLGAGFQQIKFIDDSPYTTFDPLKTCLPNQVGSGCVTLGLQGFENTKFFPTIAALTVTGTSLGGMQQMGNALVHTYYLQQKPSFNANTTVIHQNHTLKFGGEVYFQGTITNPPSAVGLSFNANATGLPFTPTAGLSGQNIGFPFASFLLGDLGGSATTAAATQIAPTDYRIGKSQWAFFAQDTWKITRKLTLDYGIRYDYGGYGREEYGRSANFGGTVPNPSAGNRLGAVIYEATCNCQFASNYPFGIGPRIGAAYQINSKTVLRGGWGVVYSFTPDVAGNAAATLNYPQTGPSPFVNIQTPGVVPQAVWPTFDAGLFPAVGTTAQSPAAIDRNAGRPARQNQYSFGIQHEVSRDLVVEASFVANRGVWWAGQGAQSGTGPLGYLNQVSPDVYAKFGLSPYTSVADNTLIAQQINTTAVIAKVGNLVPYSGFPTSSSLTQALRPYPQFSALNVTVSPTGRTWYDSLQAKVTKRFSHGLQVNSNFTWSKAFVLLRQDLFNPSMTKSIQSTDQPFLLNLNATYTTPGATFLKRWKAANLLVKDWQIGTYVQYGSGLPLAPPTRVSTNNLATGGSQIRVPGVPLYLKDPNCHCINPYTDQVLNPAGWQDPAQGVFSPGPTGASNLYYTDFRGPRRPQENINFGRNFRIKERMNLQIRAEFVNMFNRTYLQNITTTGNPINPPSKNGSGQITSGFGTINEAVAKGAIPTLAQPPRTGTLIARFTF
jgi:hypothetical protein